MWHVSSHSSVATLQTAIHLLLTYLLTSHIIQCEMMIGRSLQTITHTHWFCAAWRKGLRRSLGLPHTTAIPFRYLVFLALYHCLTKYVNVLLSLLLWFSLLFCIVSLRCVTIHLFWEICVFSVKCLIGEIVILYVVGFLCHNSILLNVIVIDFLMFRRVWLVCCCLGDNYLVFSGDFNFNHSGIIPLTASHVQKG